MTALLAAAVLLVAVAVVFLATRSRRRLSPADREADDRAAVTLDRLDGVVVRFEQVADRFEATLDADA